MADRTVVVRLLAMVDQFRAGMASAGQSVNVLDRQVAAHNAKTRAALASTERAAKSSQQKMMGTFGAMRSGLLGIGVPLAVGAIVKSFLDFERQMAHVQAVSDKFGRSDMGMKLMRDSALSMGQAYGFTAVEVGKAQEELAKAGLKTHQILGGSLKASLTLAAAGTISLSEAAQHTAVIMTQFGLKSGDSQRIVDQLSKAANATVSDVGAMATALSYAGQQAHSMGVPLEDAVATISLFNQAGIDADMAGTNFRGMLVALGSPSAMAAEQMEKLKISMYDANHEFIGMAGLAEMLKQRLGGLNPEKQAEAIGKIFSNAQIPGVITMIKNGADGFNKMKAAIEATASAEDTARDKLNSLAGDIEKFGSAIQASAIRTLENVNGPLRFVTQSATELTKGFGEMGGAAQLALGALALHAVTARRVHGGYQALSGGIREATTAYRNLNAAAALRTSAVEGPRVFGPQLPTGDDTRRLGDTAAQFTGVAGAAGRATASIGTASGATSKFGAISATALAGARAGWGSLSSFLGGPWGVALAVGTAAFAGIASEMAQSKARVEDLRASLLQLGMAYSATGNMYDSSIQSLVAQSENMRSLINRVEEFGLKQADVGKAVTGDQKAQQRVLQAYDKDLTKLNEKILDTSVAWGDFQGVVDLFPFVSSEHEKARAAFDRVLEERQGLKKEFEDAKKFEQAMSALRKEALEDELKKLGMTTSKASEQWKATAANLAVLNSQKATAADRLKAMASNVDMLVSSYTSLASAQAAFHAAGREKLPEVLGKGGKGKAPAAKRDWVTGQFDVTTTAGAAQHTVVAEMAEASAATIKAAYNKAYAATSGDAEAAGAVAVAQFTKQRNAARATLATLTGNKKMAEELLNVYFAMPADIATVINVQGMDAAISNLNHLGVQLTTMPDGRLVVYAETAKALSDVGAVKVEKIGDKKFRAILSNAGDIKGILDNAVPERKDTTVGAKPDSSVNATERRIDDAASKKRPPAVIEATASTNAAEAALNALTRPRSVHITAQMPNIPSSISIPVKPRYPQFVAPMGPPSGVGGPFTGRRWGGVSSFAGGGIAQVAGPGTLYQWAEPETGGEAFIPRKGDPARSKAVLDTAASWYGMRVEKMAKGGVMSFATGGINAPLSEMFSRYTSKAVTKEDFDAANKKRLDAIAAVQKAERALNAVKANGKRTTKQLLDAEASLARQRRNLTAVTGAYNKASAGYAITRKPKWEQFRGAMAMGVKNTNAFLWALKKLADRGFGQLAQQLLAMGGPEAEQIAQGAMKASDAALKGTAWNVGVAVKQQKSLENFPAILAVRGALKSGTSYGQLIGSGQVTAEALNSALALMESELKKTAAGKAMLAAMGGANAQALQADMRRFASGGIAAEGTMYRYAEPGTGGEAVIPRFGANGPAVLRKAAAWHGMSVASDKPWDKVMQRAGASNVQITVRGEGVLSGMIEATVDGRMVQVARAVRHGTRG